MAAAAALLLVLSLAAQATEPPRDPKPVAGGPAATIAGRVLDSVTGLPVSGALVTVLSTLPGASARHVEAGPGGEFQLRNLTRRARISVGPPPMQATHLTQVVQLDRTIDESEVVVRLDRALAVEGRLLDERDEPMANVRAVAEPLDSQAIAAERREHFSDGQGVFRIFGLPPGRYRICAVPERRVGVTSYVKTCHPADDSAVDLRRGTDVPRVTIRVQRVKPDTAQADAEGAERLITIRGRILDEPTMAALPRALVSLTSPAARTPFEAVADERGYFDLRVPPGPYDLRAAAGAFKSTHVATSFGSGRGGRPRELLLMSGDTFDEFAIALPRAAALRGEVTSVAGAPLADVVIELVPLAATTPLTPEHPPATDDRGRFSAHGIPPGRYTMCANPSPPSRRAGMSGGWAYAQACLPSPIVVRAGDMPLPPIRLERQGTYSIAGRVVGPGGEVPLGAFAALTIASDSRTLTDTLPLEPDGSFLVSGLAAGLYELSAYTLTDPRRRTREAGQWMTHRVEIVDADVANLMLQMSEGATVRGRVTIDDPTSDRSLAGIDVRAVAVARPRAPSAPPVETHDDGAFTLRGVFDESVLRVRTPLGYDVTSVRYAGRDITDKAIEFSGDPSLFAEIVLSRANAALSGRVVDDDGRAVEDAGILYFPADPARWKAYEGGLRQQSIGGRYRIDKIPGGDYLVIAVRGPRPGWTEKDYAALAPLAERVSLAGGEQRALDLRVVTLGR